jgi:hypothetical protein
MSLRDGVFACWIAGLSLFGNDLSLSGDTALQLRLHFSATSLFERIGATAGKRCARDQEKDRQGPHPLILGMKSSKANRQD